jgi:hypothetical protein
MPIEEPPATQEEYIEWAKASIGANFDEDAKRLYTRNVTLALVAAESNAFFADLDDFLREAQEQYQTEKNSDLLMSDTRVKLFKKPYESAVNKSFRQ